MICKSPILLGLAAVPAAVNAASFHPTRASARSPKNPGFLSFPIQKGRSTNTLTGRQSTASLVNEQDTSYLIECESPPSVDHKLVEHN